MQSAVEEGGDWTHLHAVAWDGNIEAARMLLEVGHPVDPQIATGHTPLHMAAQLGNVEIARLLLDEKRERDASERAAVDARTSSGITPLYLAIQKGQLGMAQLLLDSGAAINAQTETGYSALHMTAQNGMLAEAAMLLERGCAVDLKAVAGHTPLHLAATYGNAEMIELLLQAGHASVDAEDNTGRRYSVYLLDWHKSTNTDAEGACSPLHFAAQKGAHACVEALLAYASSVDTPSSRGLTPLDVAAYAAPPPGDAGRAVSNLLLHST